MSNRFRHIRRFISVVSLPGMLEANVSGRYPVLTTLALETNVFNLSYAYETDLKVLGVGDAPPVRMVVDV